MSFDINDLKVCQIVYVKPVGNAARWLEGDILEHIKESEVEKVGNKFFYLKEYQRYKFGLKYVNSKIISNISECSISYEVYLSKQEIIDDLEKKQSGT